MADFEDFTKRLLQIVMFYILKHRLQWGEQKLV